MKCHFCNGHFPKLAKSHIIPRSFFKLLQGKDNYSIVFQASKKETIQDFKQAGIYDNQILCIGCERKFSAWDKHGFEVFSKVFLKKQIYVDPQGYACALLLPNVDFPILKLFCLSLLWRASVSKLPFFDRVVLGPYEAIIKGMLESRDPGPPEDFSIACIHHLNHPFPKTMMPPWKGKVGKVRCYRFYLPDVMLLIKVDKKPFESPLNLMTLGPKSPHYLLYMPYGTSAEKGYIDQMKAVLKEQKNAA